MQSRSGRIKTSEPPKKRKYTRKNKQNQDDVHAHDEDQPQLLLEASDTETLETTFDEYDRIVFKSNVNYYKTFDDELNVKGCLTEEEDDNNETNVPVTTRKNKKQPAYKKIDDRDYCFANGNLI